jgi:hypothetical protein
MHKHVISPIQLTSLNITDSLENTRIDNRNDSTIFCAASYRLTKTTTIESSDKDKSDRKLWADAAEEQLKHYDESVKIVEEWCKDPTTETQCKAGRSPNGLDIKEELSKAKTYYNELKSKSLPTTSAVDTNSNDTPIKYTVQKTDAGKLYVTLLNR